MSFGRTIALLKNNQKLKRYIKRLYIQKENAQQKQESHSKDQLANSARLHQQHAATRKLHYDEVIATQRHLFRIRDYSQIHIALLKAYSASLRTKLLDDTAKHRQSVDSLRSDLQPHEQEHISSIRNINECHVTSLSTAQSILFDLLMASVSALTCH